MLMPSVLWLYPARKLKSKRRAGSSLRSSWFVSLSPPRSTVFYIPTPCSVVLTCWHGESASLRKVTSQR